MDVNENAFICAAVKLYGILKKKSASVLRHRIHRLQICYIHKSGKKNSPVDPTARVKSVVKSATFHTNSKRFYNIKMNLQEVGWGDMDWIHMAQDRVTYRALVNATMNLRVP